MDSLINMQLAVTLIACFTMVLQGAYSQVVIPRELEGLASPLTASTTGSLLTTYFKEGVIPLCNDNSQNVAKVYCHPEHSTPSRRLTSGPVDVCLGAFDYAYSDGSCSAEGSTKFSTTFFQTSSMKAGNSMQLPNTTSDNMDGSKFLPNDLANIVIQPLKSSNYSLFLHMFGVTNGSAMEHFINTTIAQCSSSPPLKSEVHACPISLEQTIKFVTETIGTNFTVLTPPPLPKVKAQVIRAQLLNKKGQKVVSCHKLNFPSLVLKCHLTKMSMLFDISLKIMSSKSHNVLHGLAICHVDTSYWNPSHVSFKVLHTKPGQGPICHWIPQSTIVFIENKSM